MFKRRRAGVVGGGGVGVPVSGWGRDRTDYYEIIRINGTPPGLMRRMEVVGSYSGHLGCTGGSAARSFLPFFFFSLSLSYPSFFIFFSLFLILPFFFFFFFREWLGHVPPSFACRPRSCCNRDVCPGDSFLFSLQPQHQLLELGESGGQVIRAAKCG